MPNKVKITLDKNFSPSIVLNGKNIDNIKACSWTERGKLVQVSFVADELEVHENNLVPIRNRYIRVEEELLLTGWRDNPEMHEAVMKLLGFDRYGK